MLHVLRQLPCLLQHHQCYKQRRAQSQRCLGVSPSSPSNRSQLCLLEGELGRCLCFLRALGAGLHEAPAGWCTRRGCDFVAVSFSRSWPGAQPCCTHPFPTSCSTGLQGLRAWQTSSINLEEPCTHAEEEEVPGTAGTCRAPRATGTSQHPWRVEEHTGGLSALALGTLTGLTVGTARRMGELPIHPPRTPALFTTSPNCCCPKPVRKGRCCRSLGLTLQALGQALPPPCTQGMKPAPGWLCIS